jgi:HEAT repeat protein
VARGRPVRHWVDELHSEDFRRRQTAVQVLGNVGPVDRAALDALAGALKDSDPRIRDAAVLALMKSGSAARGAVPALKAAFQDDDPSVRDHAAAALRRIRGAG